MSVEISREFLSDNWPARSLCAASVSVLGHGQSLIEVMCSVVLSLVLLIICRLAGVG